MRILARLRFALPIAASAILTMLVAAKSTQSPAAFALWVDSSSQTGSVSQGHKISNPAAVYCTDMGYEYHVISDAAGGQTDTCSLPDGSVCSAWDFLEGKCGEDYSYCARLGLSERTSADGNNPFSSEYAVCVDSHGKDVGQVSTLFELAPKLNRCGNTSGPPDASPNPSGTTLPAAADSTPPLRLTGAPPDSWDWRDATFNGIRGDWTSPVKDQAGCGSCWAFAAVGQTEAVLNLAASNPGLDKDLSEEYLVSDCSSAGSCCGGWHSSALDFIRKQGIPDEACLPYVSGSCGCYGSGVCSCTNKSNGSCANSTCSQRCSDYGSRLSKIDAYGFVSSNQSAIKQALVTYGPLSVAIDVSEGDSKWSGDVFTCPRPSSVNHSVVIVGYNDAGGYWIVKNSWGSGWNGNGFFKVGYGQCQIENYVYYATILRTISGYVRTSSGSGISGVVMNGLPGKPTTDMNGYYSDQVNNGWSGTVSPSKADYVFDPKTLNYPTVAGDLPNQIYTGHTFILLVDDDDNAPDVRYYYTDALTAIGKSYDVWDTSTSGKDPDAGNLTKYDIVIWFTGNKSGGNTGPDAAGEAALSSFLDGGGNLLISSQEYYSDRCLTTFMSTYLGVSSVNNDTKQTTATGKGSVFSGLGPYALNNYPFENHSDTINPRGSAETAFNGDNGIAGVDKKAGGYHSAYLGFPFEALQDAPARLHVMKAFLEWSYHQAFLPLVTHH